MSKIDSTRNLVSRLQGWMHRLGIGTHGKLASSSDLSGIEASLMQLNRSTEADFLAVGGMLGNLVTSARRISTDAGTLSGFVSGERSITACTALSSVLTAAGEMKDHAAAKSDGLSTLRESVASIRGGFAGFTQTSSSFRLVATLARIETERLGNANSDISHLAGEFRSRTDDVAARVGRMVQDATSLEKSIALTLQNESELQSRELQALPSLIANVEANLAAFRARQSEAATTSTALASQFDSLSVAISDIVGSIQLHDITRQQIEHVIEALQELQDESKSFGSASQSRRGALRLQRAQLDSARGAFLSSVSEIDRKLDVIANQTRDMAATSRNLLGVETDDRQSFFTVMESSFSDILEAICHCDRLSRDFEGGMTLLNDTLQQLTASIQDIQAMALQIKWLALNARISAIHLGVSGEPLNIVAEAMQGLGSDCEVRCDQTDTGLRSMKDAIGSVSAGGTSSEHDRNDMVAGVRARIQELKSLRDQSLERVGQITACAESLCGEIESARNRFSVGQLFSDTVDSCCQLLDEAAMNASDALPEGNLAFDPELDQMAARYTMRAERDVHEDLIGISQSVPDGAQPLPELARTQAAGDYGENVEFF